MAVLIGAVTPITTVYDDRTLELLRANGIHTLSLGDATYVYVAGVADHGVSSFRLGSDGSLTNIQNIPDNATLELARASNFASVTVGTTTYLYACGFEDNGISGFSVASNGTLTNVTNLTDNATLELDGPHGRMATATVGSSSFLISGAFHDDGLSVFRVGANGQLTNTANVADNRTLNLNNTWDTAAVTVGGTTFVVAAGSLDDGVSVFRLGSNGTLTNVQNLTDDATLELDGVGGLASAVVGGTTFVVASSFFDNSLSVFSMDGSGQLTSVFNVTDTEALGLEGASSPTIFTLDTETFVAVSGENDYALGIYHLAADGRLTDVTTIFDDASIALGSVFGNAFANVEGSPLLVTAANIDDGVTTFDIGSGNDTLTGTASSDVLLGLAGNDRLDGGAGADKLRGGSGDDTYYVGNIDDTVGEEAGAGNDTVYASVSYSSVPNVENLILTGSTSSSAFGNGRNNTLTGNTGSNDLRGKAGDDAIWGQGGKDQIEGGDGDDSLSGGQKADVLQGGRGRDLLQGDGGRDVFVFVSLRDSGTLGGTRDRILDFGKDVIDLSQIDAVKGQAGNQAFVLDEGGAFEAGKIRIRDGGAGLRVELNVDDDARADMAVLLEDVHGALDLSSLVV